MQETHIGHNAKEIRKNYTWFFSGQTDPISNKETAGVGIVIRNELTNYIFDIQPIDSRIIYLALGYSIPIHFLGGYAPTAEYGEDIKILFYKKNTE